MKMEKCDLCSKQAKYFHSGQNMPRTVQLCWTHSQKYENGTLTVNQLKKIGLYELPEDPDLGILLTEE
jgi:hypothetical protein